MTEISPSIEWSEDIEIYFKKIGEQGAGLSWLHKQSEARYARFRNFIDLPVIVLGVLNGATSVGSNSLFNDPKIAGVAVGIVAIIGAILSTISSYFKWSARAEAHRIAAIQYGKMSRYLTVQLGLPRIERMTASDCLKYCKAEFDRLQEISPLIPSEIVAMFQQRFKKYTVSVPSECNGVESIKIHKESVLEIISPVSNRDDIRPVHTVSDP